MKVIEGIKSKPKTFLVFVAVMMLICIIAGFVTGFQSGIKNYVDILDEKDIICIEKDNPALSGGIILSEGINISQLRNMG